MWCERTISPLVTKVSGLQKFPARALSAHYGAHTNMLARKTVVCQIHTFLKKKNPENTSLQNPHNLEQDQERSKMQGSWF